MSDMVGSPKDSFFHVKAHIYLSLMGLTRYSSHYFNKSKISEFTLLAHLSQRLTGELIVYPCSGVRPSFTISKIFSSETAWPIKAKLHVEHP